MTAAHADRVEHCKGFIYSRLLLSQPWDFIELAGAYICEKMKDRRPTREELRSETAVFNSAMDELLRARRIYSRGCGDSRVFLVASGEYHRQRTDRGNA